MRYSGLLISLLLAGCASYVVPGGAVRLDSINRADIAEIASRKPAAKFPAVLAIVRIQAASYRYALGHVWQETLKVLAWYDRKQFTLIPNIALSSEHRQKDKQNHQQVEYTGGQTTSAIIGCDVTVKRHGTGLQAGIPISQHLGDGYVHQQPKISFYYIYLLQKHK